MLWLDFFYRIFAHLCQRAR